MQLIKPSETENWRAATKLSFVNRIDTSNLAREEYIEHIFDQYIIIKLREYNFPTDSFHYQIKHYSPRYNRK